LIWNPLKSEIASSGEIGYTFGEWKYFMKDSINSDTSYGNYMSVWKKQDDGSWKFVIDGGNVNAEKNK
jgi:ketosteroid isomerase-like protein